MVVATFGLVYIAYRASSVSIEIADAKINLSSALSTVKDIKSDLEAENERLKRANDELQAKLKSATGDVAKVIRDPSIGLELKELLQESPLGGDNAAYNAAYMRLDQKLFDVLDSKIQEVENAVKAK